MARYNQESLHNLILEKERIIKTGDLDKNTIYIVDEKIIGQIKKNIPNGNYRIIRINSLNILLANQNTLLK